MKTYLPIPVNRDIYLRLSPTKPGLVSPAVFEEHERLYIESAIILLNPIPGKEKYNENELQKVWQFAEDVTQIWADCAEPGFIGTLPNQYREAFKTITINIVEPYQKSVANWIGDTFGTEYIHNIPERAARHLEEVLELMQALGIQRDEIYRLVTYVYGRPVGEVEQELGGAILTLAGLSEALQMNFEYTGELELSRVINKGATASREKHEKKKLQGIAQ